MGSDISFHKLSLKRQAEVIVGKFNLQDTKNGIKYSLSGAALRDVLTITSENAFNRLQNTNLLTANGIKRCYSYNEYDICIEHIIPTEVVYERFETLFKVKQLTTQYVEDVIRERLLCALITKDEDNLLSQNGLRKTMPVGWDFDTGSLFARYEAIGLTLHRW